jgi:hypothetical protein
MVSKALIAFITVLLFILAFTLWAPAALAGGVSHDESYILYLRGGLCFPGNTEYRDYGTGSHGGIGLVAGFNLGNLGLELGPHLVYQHIPEKVEVRDAFHQPRSVNSFSLTVEARFRPNIETHVRPYLVFGFGYFDLSGGEVAGVGVDLRFSKRHKWLLYSEIRYLTFAMGLTRIDFGLRLY